MKVLRIAHHAVVSAWRQRERELRRLGVDVELVSSKVWNEGGRDVALEPGGDDFVRGAATVGGHPSVFAYDPRPIWRAIGERPDLIDLHEEPNSLATAEVLLIGRLRRSTAPYVLYSAQNIRKRFPIPFRWLERAALHGASGAYVCNVEAGEILTAKGLGGPAVHIPLGVDVRTFAPADRVPPADGSKVVGYVGRLEPHKGVDVLLRAAAGHEDWQVRLTGDGPQRAELEALSVQLGMAHRVHFLGFASGPELADRYRELDVLAVPSLARATWLEQFCRVAVEAMASGVPVVASDTGAIPDVVGDAGLLVPSADPRRLADAIARALEPTCWADLRARGLQRSVRFTWENVASMQKAMYESVLGGGDAGAAQDPHVLIVAYGSPAPLEGCLAELGSGLPVTIVDNSSLPETRTLAERHGARYVDAGRNLGFAGGVNLGLETIEACGEGTRDVLLLNPDARISPEGVRTMHELLHSAQRRAAVGATQTDPETGAGVRVWWPFPTPAGAWIEAVGLGGLRRRRDFAIGSALLLRREALQEVGRLDERFFLYAEETDWQRRARSRGWDIAVADVAATHEGGGTGGDPRQRERHFYGSAERYIRKHYGPAGWQLYRAGTLVGAAVRGSVLPGERGAAARRRAALFRHGPVAVETGAVGPRRTVRPPGGPMHVVHVVCSEAFAGVERYVLQSALALTAEGCRVTVIGGGPDTMGAALGSADIAWHPAATAAAAFRTLRRLTDADVVVTHMTLADLAGAAARAAGGAPVVSVRHFAARRGSNAVNKVLAAAARRRIAAQLAISRFVADSIEGESVVVHTGVSEVPDVDDAVREPFLLVLQRLEREKATDVAVRAWAAAERPPGWRLVIVGDGAEKDALIALAAELGVADSVEFAGFQNDVSDWLRRASVLVAPTPREGLGLAVLEAMAHGLPVVAAAGGGHLETVGSVPHAALFAPGDADEAAREISRLLADPERRHEYGRELRSRQRQEFGVAAQTAATVALLDSVARADASRRRFAATRVAAS
ncbi:glycosyltransferase [Rathayibacter sp. KR2-224]|uniref:glycosyltransferase n=1 Tax=Rathayibacter sp. KR2-224 TaxID=3400913 RepID=UPI003C11965E